MGWLGGGLDVGYVPGDERVGCLGNDLQRVLVNGNDLLQVQKAILVAGAADAGLKHLLPAIQCELECLSIHRLAVVEGVAFLDLELPGNVVDGFPGFGHVGLQLDVRVPPCQRLEQMLVDIVIGDRLADVRVQGDDLGALENDHRFLRLGRGRDHLFDLDRHLDLDRLDDGFDDRLTFDNLCNLDLDRLDDPLDNGLRRAAAGSYQNRGDDENADY